MSKKRGHGEGSFVLLTDGRWQGRVRYTDMSNIQKRKAVYGKNQKEARGKIKQFLKDLQEAKEKASLPPNDNEKTVSTWLDEWLENYVKRQRRLTTWENYNTIIKNHIKPEIGAIKLTELTSVDLQNLYNKKLDSGRADGGGGLSPQTVRLIHLICHASLKRALKNKLVILNVAEAAETPPKQRKEIQPMNEEQIRQLMMVSKEDRLFAAFYLLVSTGMRRGEVLGLKWTDVDFEAGTIHIQRSLVKTSTEQAKFHPTKTQKSNRLVPLTLDVVEVLKQHQTRQEAEKAKLETAYNDQDMVFCREDGVPLYPDVLDGKFQKLLTKAGLPHFRVHDLRHTFATIMLKQDVHAKIVQEILGHSNIGVTLDTYSHVLPTITKEAMQKMQSVLQQDKDNPEASEQQESVDTVAEPAEDK